VKSFFENKNISSVELPLDDSGRSSGTAFVSFGSRAALDDALAKDGQTLAGSERWLKITEGKPARKSLGTAPDATAKPEGCDTVFVGNLPWDVDENQMYELFGQCGEVAKVRFATSAEDGSFKGFAHVQFSSADSVDAAVQLYGTDLNGRAIRVDYAPPRNRESLGGGRGEGGRGRGGRGDGRGRGGRDGGRGRGRGTPTTGNKNKGTIGTSTPQGKKISFD
jgi:nucleolin